MLYHCWCYGVTMNDFFYSVSWGAIPEDSERFIPQAKLFILKTIRIGESEKNIAD